MAWIIGIVVVLVVAVTVRRLVRGRRSPSFDQNNLENANYSRLTQDITNTHQHHDPFG